MGPSFQLSQRRTGCSHSVGKKITSTSDPKPLIYEREREMGGNNAKKQKNVTYKQEKKQAIEVVLQVTQNWNQNEQQRTFKNDYKYIKKKMDNMDEKIKNANRGIESIELLRKNN